ncbi:ESPR-type extended signal peptide-containing protein [Veillonella sp. R32]|uniref:ESPR-type extended signal peptide-containing protein n=1 Tax=Veillonella sp. R32 TaxID=2021312 RepID=UPI00138A2F24|nr:ESPR-type extended signal peptide-containing protein [Veillonella sp. R32]
MNKIYKIVWSRTKHCYVVASEFAKGHTKSSSEKTSGAFKLGATLAAVALLGGIGVHSSVLAVAEAGLNAKASGKTAVAIGDSAIASGQQAIAIGGSDAGANVTQAIGKQSIAIGGNVRVDGYGTIGIGGDDLRTFRGSDEYNKLGSTTQWVSNQYTEYNDNPTYGNGDGAIFIGIRSIGSGHGAVTLGSLSQATASVATALGMGAKANKVASVALGAASDTNKDAAQVSNATIKGSTYNFAGTINNTPGAVVSVGNSTVQRQIINVAPGAVTATSTDAINGSQLFAVANNITKTTVAVGSESLTLSTADTTATNGLLAYIVDLSSTAKSAIADIPTIKSNLASTASTATAASSAAVSAASKADAANTAAASANTAASTAQSTANAAQTTANAAKAVADTAVQNLTVGTDSAHNGTGVTLTKNNNRLDIVGLGSVTTAVSSTNTINVGLTSSAESSIGAVAGISTAVTRIDGTVTNISSTVTRIDSTVSTIQTDLSTVKNDWDTVKNSATKSVQELKVGAGTGTTITLDNKTNTLDIVGANSNANIITQVNGRNIAIDLSDSFKAQIHNLENKSNGSSVTYVTNDGQKVVKIDNAFYPEGTTLDKDGRPVDAQGNQAQPTDVKPEEIKVTVGDDTARQIGNVASGLDGLAADSNTTAISATEAKTAVGGADGKGGLLGKTGKDLNNVATIKDLQAVAQAGLNFTGDTVGADKNKVTVHRPLSDTLAITGGVAEAGKLTDDNIGVVADETNGLTVKLAKNIDLGADGSLNFGKDVSLTPGKGLSFTKDGGTAVYGPTGTTLTDKEGNTTVTNAAGSTLKDKDGNKTTVTGNGITINPKEDGKGNVSLTKDGLDNGGNKLKNVAAGTEDGDVVNFEQYKELSDKVADMGTNSPSKLVDNKGNEVVKIGDNYYPAGTTKTEDGKFVNANGEVVEPIDTTTTPISAATNTPNSGLGIQLTDSTAPIANDGEKGANALVGGTAGADGVKTGGLLQAAGNDLAKIATVGDLQAVAQAGLNFIGDTVGADNNKVTVHRPLSDTLAITGGVANSEDLTDKNIGVVAYETKGLTVKLAKNIDLGTDGSLNFGDNVSLTPGEGLSFAKDGDTAVYGPTGTSLKDKEGNTTVTNAAGSTLTDKEENKTVISAKGTTVTDKEGNTNTSTSKENKLADDKGNSNTANASGVTVEKTVDGKTISNSLTADALTTKGADGKETSVKADGITTNGNITATDTAGNKTTVDGNGITIDPKEDGKGNVSLTKDGLDNGGNRLKNIGAAEKSGDAVTFDQFKALEKKFSAAGGMTTVDEDGDKVVTVGDRQYKVDENGNPLSADKKTKLIEVDGKYYNPSDVNEDGTLKDNAQPADSTVKGNTALSSDAPTSGLGLTKAVKGDDANGIQATGPIDATTAKNVVGGADGKSGLLGKSGADLNKIVTVQDLQAVAQAGLNFTGDTVDAAGNKVNVHRPLSNTLSVTGGVVDETSLTDKNIGVVANQDNGLTVKLAKNIDLGADGSLKFGNNVSLTPGEGLSFTKDGDTAVYGPTGTTLTDKEGNTTVTNAAGSTLKDKEGNTTVTNAASSTLTDKEENKTVISAKGTVVSDKAGNTNTSTAKENKLADDKGNSNTANATGVTVEKTVDGKTISNSLTADALTTKGADGKETSVKADGITTNGNITATDTAGNKTTVDGNGITIDPAGEDKGNVSLTKDGLDNGGNRLKNIGAAEKSGDAVTFDQFKALERKFSAAGGMETVDENGDKVVTIDDQVYKVDQDGNPVDKDGNKLKEVDGKYYNPDDVTDDGKLKSADAEPAKSTATGDTSLSSNAGASGLGLTKAIDADKDNGIEGTGPISGEDAKKALVGEDGKDGLLTISGKALNKLVTVQDLQAVAQAGLDFAGDDANDVHRPLSSKLTITGGVTEKADLTDKNIGVVRNETGDGLEVKLAKHIDLGEDGSIKLGDKVALDGKDGLTVKGDDGNSAVYGGNGLTLTDKDGNSSFNVYK